MHKSPPCIRTGGLKVQKEDNYRKSLFTISANTLTGKPEGNAVAKQNIRRNYALKQTYSLQRKIEMMTIRNETFTNNHGVHMNQKSVETIFKHISMLMLASDI